MCVHTGLGPQESRNDLARAWYSATNDEGEHDGMAQPIGAMRWCPTAIYTRVRAVAVLATAALWLPSISGCALARHPQHQPPAILLFGDSLCSSGSKFYPAMQAEFPGVEIVPAGITGASTWMGADMFCLQTRPDLIVVLMGVNNPTHDRNYPPEWAWLDIEAIRAKARTFDVPVLIGTPLAYAEFSPQDNSRCPLKWNAPYVRQLRDLLLNFAQPDVVDFDEAIPPAEVGTWFDDCLHPNEAGARRMAGLVRSVICAPRRRREFRRLCDTKPPPAAALGSGVPAEP